MAKVLTDPQHYTDIAAAIREKNGTSNTYTPADMANAILGIETGGGGSLDHTVTFKDDSGNVVAIYSVIDGVGNIAMPSGVTAKKWIDNNGNAVTFPINPTDDVIIMPDNTLTVTEAIYHTQEFDINEYPYIWINVRANSPIATVVYFAPTMGVNGSYYKINNFQYTAISGERTLTEAIYILMNEKQTGWKIASGGSYATNEYCATNFKPLLNGTKDIDNIVVGE